MTKDVWFEKMQEALTEARVDLLAMAPEGAGCYCANTLARKYIDLLTGNYPYIVIDNEEEWDFVSNNECGFAFILSIQPPGHHHSGPYPRSDKRAQIEYNQGRACFESHDWPLQEDTQVEARKNLALIELFLLTMKSAAMTAVGHLRLSASVPAVQAAWLLRSIYCVNEMKNMTAKLINGNEIAAQIRDELRRRSSRKRIMSFQVW